MTQTMFITGASSGIGHATAKYFAEKGWQVAATMRKPEKETELNQLPGVKLYSLDVTDAASIAQARDAAIADFDQIDVVVNNAGYAVSGYFEDMSEAQIKRQYDVNVFGLMRVTKAFLPHFRAKHAGTFVNISSIGGLLSFPGIYVYNSTKFAVEGFSEGISYELKELGIRTILIEPGNIKTDFNGRSMDKVANKISDYDTVSKKLAAQPQPDVQVLMPDAIAKLIDTALQDQSGRVRYLSEDVVGMAQMRQTQGAEAFMKQISKTLLGD